MRKVVVHRAGGYERLELETHPDPRPGAGEVLIDVAAIGVNFADCVVRMGLYASAKEYVGWPITPGFEVAGTITEVGSGVTTRSVGDAVIGLLRFGGYATRVVTPEDQTFLRPADMTFERAAAFSVVHLTAYYALIESCRLREGMNVLVHSAAGGVGSALVRIAKIHGAQVTAVVGRSHKTRAAIENGADHVIDKSRQDLWKEARRISPHGFDAVLDPNGVETLRQSYAHLCPTGRLVVYGFTTMLRRGGTGRPPWLKLARDFLRTPRFSPLDMTNDNKSVLAFNLSYLFEKNDLLQEAMSALFTWHSDGRLGMPSIERFRLGDVAAAHRALESGDTVGKLVLVP